MMRPGFIVGVLILSAVMKIVYSNRCLTSLEEVNPKRMVHVDGQSLNIQFDLSQRVTQRLISKIMRIFLKEVLGYSGVTTVEKDDAFDVYAVFERLSETVTHAGYKKLPETMVNMEVWVPPGLDTMHLMNKYDVKEVGSVALPGHFGWFVPEALSRVEDNWMTFARRETAARFDVDERVLAIVKNYTVDPDTRRYYCERSYCQYGMYIPDQCRGTRGHKAESCALLLAADPDVTSFVKDHIDKLKLYVKIAWVGPQLKRLTDSLVDQYTAQLDNSTGGQSDQRSVVILHWTPSDVIPNEMNFTTIEFPHCGSRGLEIGCAYESNRLVKMVWAQLEVVAKFAHEAISRAYFTPDMYKDLISRHTRFSGSATEDEIACGWLKENLNYTLVNWMPNSADKNTLYVGGIFPMSGSFYTAKSIIIAAKMAKDAINQNNTVLRDYNLTLLASDGQCKSDMVMKSFIDYIVNNYFEKLVGVLGPACSETVEPLIGVSRHYKTVVISYSAEGSSFNDRTRYPYFFRTIGENKQYNLVYLQLLQRLGWRRVASLTEDGQKYTEYISYMQDTLRDNGISFVANVKFPREREGYSMTKYLEDLKQKRAKIIIADVYDRIARQVMCEAYKLEMTAVQGYVWFLPLWLRPRWYDTDYYNEHGEEVECNTEEMQKAINGHLGLSHAYYAPDDEIMQENVTVRQWRERYENLCHEKNLVPSSYAGFAYDAMWTYAFAMDRLLRENQSYVFELHTDQTVNRLTEIIAQTDFKGVSGKIQFINGPSRYSVITIVQRVDDEIRPIGNYYPNVTGPGHEVTMGRLDLNVSGIVWLSNSKPDDGSEPPPSCVLSGLATLLDVSCEVAIVVVNLIGLTLVGALLVIGFIIVKRKYDEKLRQHEKYMKSFGLDPSLTADTSDLDKWEISRDRVVINRKIGEGAFGTVYGGEALFPEKGWLAVAVKTLKIGSTTEEKLDFLSEVEVMKRFDHKNIIKLLAVCIKGEPVLTVMEFMLYGDLKTYLLARRHLVKDRSYEDSDEISNKRLTSMALDVARALSYLAQLKYVHRDVASRNCLVNAQRVVKLGDFGMTRPMYENDYYKFNRKGMLPVRWMAPESLGLGIFTPASDVWSYGVLLYEIVTFGSFPFQGMSNNQVLTHVKAGNSLVVPKGVKPQLENLMYNCWTVEHSKRPTAPEIVDFLASNPRILAPCLDVPLASVQLEHSGQIEMLDLPENLRKFSVPLGWPLNHQQSVPSSEDSPDSPLLDISCHEQTQNKSSGLVNGGRQVLERNNLAPLFPPPGATVFADLAKKKEEIHKYVNLQPGQLDKCEENGDVNIPMTDRKTSLATEKDSPTSVSIF